MATSCTTGIPWNIWTPTEQHKERFTEELFRTPAHISVSADPKYRDDVKRCAEAVKESLLKAGPTTPRFAPPRAIRSSMARSSSGRTSPRCWSMVIMTCSPGSHGALGLPFEPVIKNGNIYARAVPTTRGSSTCT